MPRGTRHCVTGTLRETRLGYVLHVDGGGQWRLDTWRSPRRYVGQRVTVEGIRSGFDLLDVVRITPCDAVQPLCRRWAMIVRDWAMALTG